MICRFVARFRTDGGPLEPLPDRRSLPGSALAETCAIQIITNDPGRIVAAPKGPGLLVGRAFRRSGGAVAALSVGEQHALGVSSGGWAVDHLWGSFALLLRRGDGVVHVLRDPSGGLPIYHAEHAGTRFVFSDLALALASGLRVAGIDFIALAQSLRFPMLRARPTGLIGVEEVLPGERVSFAATGARREQLWSPWRFAEAVTPADPGALRHVVTECVTAWSSQFDRIQLELSGGVDSSIVAASLRDRTTPWRAATIATVAADGDERLYARAVADRVGVELLELLLGGEANDRADPLPPPRPRPGGFGLLGRLDAALARAAQDFGAQAIFTGAGGDNVFSLIRSAVPILDALRCGRPRTAWHAAADVAAIGASNVWNAWWHAARKLVRGKGPAWPSDDRLLASGAGAQLPDHPWLDAPGAALAGKRSHVAALLRIQPFLDGYARFQRFPMIAPLLSQPVVEHCLAIPSWEWVAGGLDRAVARRAFAGDLPDLVRFRRSKGRVESLFTGAYDRQRLIWRDMLVDGVLAANHVLDRDALIRATERPATTGDPVYVRITELVDVELWARRAAGMVNL